MGIFYIRIFRGILGVIQLGNCGRVGLLVFLPYIITVFLIPYSQTQVKRERRVVLCGLAEAGARIDGVPALQRQKQQRLTLSTPLTIAGKTVLTKPII